MIWGKFVLVLLGEAMARGPHHPRGEAVVKHGHYRPSKTAPQKITHDADLLHDKEHIQDHLGDVVSEPDLSKLTDEELEFYYFQVHDTDKNSKLDGLEILQAILHTTHDDVDETSFSEEFNFYVDLIDKVLLEDDVDKDGFLSYSEYVSSRKRTDISNRRNPPSVKVV